MFYAKRRESPDACTGCLAKELAGVRRTESQENQQPGADISESVISERLTPFPLPLPLHRATPERGSIA